MGGEDRVYVLYGHVGEGMMGNAAREEFSVVQIRSEKESREESVWVFILIGLGSGVGPFLVLEIPNGPPCH